MLYLVGGEELVLHLRCPGILHTQPQVLSGGTCQLGIACLQVVEIFFRQLFDIKKSIVGSLDRSDQFIQLQLDGFTIAVLRILNEEHHQERYNRGAGIDN